MTEHNGDEWTNFKIGISQLAFTGEERGWPEDSSFSDSLIIQSGVCGVQFDFHYGSVSIADASDAVWSDMKVKTNTTEKTRQCKPWGSCGNTES